MRVKALQQLRRALLALAVTKRNLTDSEDNSANGTSKEAFQIPLIIPTDSNIYDYAHSNSWRH